MYIAPTMVASQRPFASWFVRALPPRTLPTCWSVFVRLLEQLWLEAGSGLCHHHVIFALLSGGTREGFWVAAGCVIEAAQALTAPLTLGARGVFQGPACSWSSFVRCGMSTCTHATMRDVMQVTAAVQLIV